MKVVVADNVFCVVNCEDMNEFSGPKNNSSYKSMVMELIYELMSEPVDFSDPGGV